MALMFWFPDMFFYKHLKKFSIPEDIFLNEILESDVAWFTAKNQEGYNLNFVKDKTNGNFYLSRLKNFPKICSFVEQHIKNAIVKNSYVTKCSPHYAMEKHIDTNRQTAIIMPLGPNKGILNFYIKDFNISSCNYKGPTLSRVNIVHSAVNNSDDYRYSITVEIQGSYFQNFFRYF
jgi:hypothetical protein